MNKSVLIDSVAVAAGVSKAPAFRTLDAMTELLAEKLRNGEQVTLPEFGVFKVGRRMKSEEIDPEMHESCYFQSKNIPSFKVSRELKNILSSR